MYSNQPYGGQQQPFGMGMGMGMGQGYQQQQMPYGQQYGMMPGMGMFPNQMGGMMGMQGGKPDTSMRKIFVGGLPYHTDDVALREFFSKYGDIEEAVVIMDRATGKSKGYGFVTFVTESSASDACENPNPFIDGRKANVNLAAKGAKPRPQDQQALFNQMQQMQMQQMYYGQQWPGAYGQQGMGQMGQMPQMGAQMGQMPQMGAQMGQMPQQPLAGQMPQQQYGNAGYGAPAGYDQASLDALEQQAQAQVQAQMGGQMGGQMGAAAAAPQQQAGFGQAYQAPANQYY